eukprot:1260622-Alexandrium_andersonii.AAC.1
MVGTAARFHTHTHTHPFTDRGCRSLLGFGEGMLQNHVGGSGLHERGAMKHPKCGVGGGPKRLREAPRCPDRTRKLEGPRR